MHVILKPTTTFILCLIAMFIMQIATNAFASPNFVTMKINLDKKPSIGADVEKNIQYLFSMLDKKNRNITLENIQAILNVSLVSKIQSGDVSIREHGGKGAFLKEVIHAPFDTVAPYYLDAGIPLETIQPAGLRSSVRAKGSEAIPSQTTQLFLDKRLATPSVFFGIDMEETSPDIFTGATYRYNTNKMSILLPAISGKRVLLIVNNQREKSSISNKSVIVGDDQDWNYIYSTIEGGTDADTGWVKSHIYDSSMIFMLVEQDNGTTEVLLFKWLRAGWLRINVVSASHIYRGSKRVLYSINKVFSNKNLPALAKLRAEYKAVKQLSTESLKEKLVPYAKKVSTIAEKNPILREKQWIPFVRNAAYPNTLTRIQLISLVMKNYMKTQLGVPSL